MPSLSWYTIPSPYASEPQPQAATTQQAATRSTIGQYLSTLDMQILHRMNNYAFDERSDTKLPYNRKVGYLATSEFKMLEENGLLEQYYPGI